MSFFPTAAFTPIITTTWAVRASRSAAMMSPDARTAAGSLCRGCETTRFCWARYGARVSNDTSVSCASAELAACCCWSSAWARCPRHHHAPVLEHDRKAAGCAPAKRKHLGRLGPVAARKQGGGDSGRFGRPALGGADMNRALDMLGFKC